MTTSNHASPNARNEEKPSQGKTAERTKTESFSANAQGDSQEGREGGKEGGREGGRPPRRRARGFWTFGKIFWSTLTLLATLAVASYYIPCTDWGMATGYLMTDLDAELRPSVEGVIRQWTAEESSLVEQNQLLIQLDDSVQQAALMHAQASLKAKEAELYRLESSQVLDIKQRTEQVRQAKANLDLAANNFERMLKARDSFSPKEIEEAKLRVELAESRLAELSIPRDEVMDKQITVLREQVESAKKALAQYQAELELRRVRSPIQGTVQFNRFEAGEVVKPEHVLGQVFDQRSWVVKMKVPEKYSARLKSGQPVEVSLSAYRAFRYGYFQATITRIVPVVNPQSTGDGVFYVEAKLEPRQGFELRPGMTALSYIDMGRTTWLMRLLDL